MNAVIYARYSSHAQREESIEGQLRECHEFAEKQGLTVIGEYCDHALSGKTDNRPEFQRMIKDSEKHQFSAVIMYTLDRFARNRYDSAIYKAKLKKNGCKIYYAKQPMPDTPEGIILEAVLEGYAEYYSANLARGIKRGMKENALHGVAMGNPALGYKINADRRFEIDPVGAEIVKYMFNAYDSGAKIAEMMKYCEEHNYKSTTGKPFGHNAFYHILTNDRYIGVYRFMDVVIPNGIPAIIDEDQFKRVQRRIEKHSHGKGHNKARVEYILSGKIYCGDCGQPMIGESGTSHSGSVYSYYKCSGRKRHINDCKATPIRKETLEELIVKYTVQSMLTEKAIDDIANKVVKLLDDSDEKKLRDSLIEKNKEIVKKIDHLNDAIENGMFTKSTMQRIKDLEDEQERNDVEIAQLEIKKPTISKDAIVRWLSAFRGGNVKDISYCRRIVDTLIAHVIVYEKDRQIVITFNTSDKNQATLTGSDIDELGVLAMRNPNIHLFRDDMVVIRYIFPEVWQ